MRLMLFSVVFFLLLCRNIDARSWYSKWTGGVSAVYAMSNGATMNQILVQRIENDGNLTLTGRVNTNGTGVNSSVLDPLASQGSMTVYFNLLFVVNSASNSLSMFVIDPCDATQLRLISVQPTFGFFPVSVTVNHKYACVLTGGNVTGIRCFTYDAFGLYWVPSLDRNLTSYLSQTIPPNGFSNTMSEILFTADNRALIVEVKGGPPSTPGYLLIYPFSAGYSVLSSTPVKTILTGSLWPFSMTLVGKDSLFISDGAANGVYTLTYSSTDGTISNVKFSSVNTSAAAALCWTVFSPSTEEYFVIGGDGTIVGVSLDLSSTTNPVQVLQQFRVPNNKGALDTVLVTIGDKVYLYLVAAFAYTVYGYQLNGSAPTSLVAVNVLQQGDTSHIPGLAGIASFVPNEDAYHRGYYFFY